MESSIVKCGKIWDLHIHSNRCVSAPPSMKALSISTYIDGLLDVFERYPDLEMISFTDHNSVALDVYEEFLSRENRVRLMPGIEVDVALADEDHSKHVIVYFDAVDNSKSIANIANWASSALGSVGPRTPIAIGDLLDKLLELRIPFALSPHAMKQKQRGIDYNWHYLEDPGFEANKYVDQFFCFWEASGKSSIAHAIEFLKMMDAEEKISIISFSDSKDYAKIENYLADPPQYFRSLPSFRGLQMVGSDAGRITPTSEMIPEDALGLYLGKIAFDGHIIELSTRLNAIIGGRGSGKSLLLDGVALALGDSGSKLRNDRKSFILNHGIMVENARGDVVAPNTFAFDYFNQSYIAKLFTEEGTAYRESLQSYFSSGFDSVEDIDEASIRTRNASAFILPAAKVASRELENISGLIERYAIDRNDALYVKIAKKNKTNYDKKIADLDYGQLASNLDKAIRSKVPPAIVDDERFVAAIAAFESEALHVASSYRQDYINGAFLQNKVVDEFLRVKKSISDAQKAKSNISERFEIAFEESSKDIRHRTAIVGAYIESAAGFKVHYEKSATKNGMRQKAFLFKKTLDIEHPLEYMLRLFSDYFLAEKAGSGGFKIKNINFLIDEFCFDESGYKKGKSWELLAEDLKRYELAYASGLAIEYLDGGEYRDISTMSPGTQTNVLLEYIVHMESTRPLLIDQPEDNVDNQAIFNEIRAWFMKLKRDKQVIVVTHDANIVINSDADNVVIAEQGSPGVFSYKYGALESDDIIDRASLILDGGRDAVKRRLMKYGE